MVTTSSPTGFVIAIDGPVASGKGTISPLLARKLHGFYLSTGSMYRCLAIYCTRQGININDEEQVTRAVKQIKIDVEPGRAFLNGEEVTTKLNKPDIAQASSQVAIFPKVRSVMLQRQREIARKIIKQGKIVVAEGRDTATAVFPDAKLKIFLTARLHVRAKRRLLQLEEKAQPTMTYDSVLRDTEERDRRDSDRKQDPLVKNPGKFGYVIVDTSNLTEEETIDAILKELQKKDMRK